MRTAWCVHMFLFAFQNNVIQLMQDMAQLEEQGLHDESHQLDLINLKKQLLQTKVSETLLFDVYQFR